MSLIIDIFINDVHCLVKYTEKYEVKGTQIIPVETGFLKNLNFAYYFFLSGLCYRRIEDCICTLQHVRQSSQN